MARAGSNGRAASPDGVRAMFAAKVDALLKEAVEALDTDRKLANSFKNAGNVLLPWVLNGFPVEPQGKPDKPLPEYILANSLAIKDKNPEFLPLPGIDPIVPIRNLATAAVGIGHLTLPGAT